MRRAVLNMKIGPNEGDSISVDEGSCRLIGRHLSENETAFMDRDGNRILDGTASDLVAQHLKEKAPALDTASDTATFRAEAFERGPDVILADDSISRAHAMIFFDNAGVGIIDLASTNGTFVNTERVGSAFMRDGDALALGKSEATIQVVQD